MFKRVFHFSSSEKVMPVNGRNGLAVHPVDVVGLANALQREAERPSVAREIAGPTPVLESFDEIYAIGGVKATSRHYTILKVADMLNSKHLADMTPEAKRSALMMALEAADAEIGDLLQDAVARNRALDEYEEERQEEVRNFEAAKAEENNGLHAEMERLTSQFMARIQTNSDQVAREQDKLRAWQKRKQQESQRITDAAAFCVPQGNGSNGNANGLSAMLERVNMPRR